MSSKTKDIGLLADVFRRETLDGTITRIRLDEIRPSEYQPRQDRLREIDDLAQSIQRDGLLHPLVVTRAGDHYRIISGERRFHALKKIGARDAECRILSREARDLDRIAIIENLQRVDLTAQEESSALLKLKRQEGLSDADLALQLGKSRNYITEILGIATLPEDAMRKCTEAGITDKNLMIQVVQAHRKENLDNFLAAFKQGQISTVREAKEFNKPAARKSEPGRKNPPPTSARITIEKNKVIVSLKTEAEARAVAGKIRKLFD